MEERRMKEEEEANDRWGKTTGRKEMDGGMKGNNGKGEEGRNEMN